MRVAIYARYSSDLQREASIDDQLRACRQFAAGREWTVEAEFHDAAMSGASLLRPGLQALLSATRAHAFDLVLAESMDRFSRSLEDMAGLLTRMTFAEVKIWTLAEGEITTLHVGFKGTMNALYLDDLAAKTRRGMRGRVESGKSGGGVAYGYRVVRSTGEATGAREIQPDEADIVRRILRAFVDGQSPKAIARTLNGERVPGPHGSPWGISTIHGHQTRGTGILNNELYLGRLVWNRLRYVKHPVTGKRVSRLNPANEWVITDVPHLRIIDDDLWQSVKARQASTTATLAASGRTPFSRAFRRAPHLFSGLLKCGSCTSSYVMRGRDSLVCSGRMRGTCTNRRAIQRADVEARVLGAMRDKLMTPDKFDRFCQVFTAQLTKRSREQTATQSAGRSELAGIDRKIHAIVEAIKDGYRTPAMKDELVALDARRRALASSIETPPTPLLHPSMTDVFRTQLMALSAGLAHSTGRPAAMESIRGLIKQIVIPAEGFMQVHGNLAGMLNLAAGQQRGSESVKDSWLRGPATSGTCSCGAARREGDQAISRHDRASTN